MKVSTVAIAAVLFITAVYCNASESVYAPTIDTNNINNCGVFTPISEDLSNDFQELLNYKYGGEATDANCEQAEREAGAEFFFDFDRFDYAPGVSDSLRVWLSVVPALELAQIIDSTAGNVPAISKAVKAH